MTLNYIESNSKTLKRMCPYLKRSDHDDAIIFEDESVFKKLKLKPLKLIDVSSLES